MKEILFNPEKCSILIYTCEILFAVGFYIVIILAKKNSLKKSIRFEIIGSFVVFFLIETILSLYGSPIPEYEKKGLLDRNNIPQVISFFISQINPSNNIPITNTISLDEDNSSKNNDNHLFVLDRTESAKGEDNDLDDIGKKLREILINEVLDNCATLYNETSTKLFLSKIKMSEAFLLASIISEHKNSRKNELPIHVINYLGNYGYNKRAIDLKYANDGIEQTEKCRIIKNSLSKLQKYSPKDGHVSYYSDLSKEISKVLSRNKNNKVTLTIVGDFLNEENDKNGFSLGRELKNIDKKGQLSKIRLIVIPKSDNITLDKQKKIDTTLMKFHSNFKDKLIIIPLNRIRANIQEVTGYLSSSLNPKEVVAYYDRSSTKNKVDCRLLVSGNSGNILSLKNDYSGMISVGKHEPIFIDSGEVLDVSLFNGILNLEVPREGSHSSSIRESDSGTPVAINISLLEQIPYKIVLWILGLIFTFFSLAFFYFIKYIYLPINKRLSDINIKRLLSFWAATAFIIYSCSILQISRLFEETSFWAFIYIVILFLSFGLIYSKEVKTIVEKKYPYLIQV